MYDQSPHTHSYETVAAAQASQQLGNTGAKGDYLERLIVTASGAGVTNTVTLIDGNVSIVIVPTNAPAGVYVLELRMRAVVDTTPGWKITTAATVSVVAVGQFT